MTRTIISIPEEEKRWLDRFGRRHRISSAEVVRRAIRTYRRVKTEKGLVQVLKVTAGAWPAMKGDSRAHIDSLRNEWERET
ncbi:MAG: CopG family transcriptional regulator [Candidatus Aminicenantes bacterium]|nr:CopG family transcriptional regulator [Candidatus Aminicenantes bacterium]